MRRKYVGWRYALVCERLRCEPWRPWGWVHTLAGLSYVFVNVVVHSLSQSRSQYDVHHFCDGVTTWTKHISITTMIALRLESRRNRSGAQLIAPTFMSGDMVVIEIWLIPSQK